MENTAADLAAATSEQSLLLPQKNWKWLALRGVLALALGVVAVIFPARALFAFTILLAAFLMVDGVLSFVTGLRGAASLDQRWWTLILRGVAGVAIGVIFLIMPFVATIGYAFATLVLLAGWSIMTGVMEIAAAIRLRREIRGEWLLGLSGVLSILLGLAIPVLAAAYPVASLLSVAWIIGVYAMAAGMVLLVQAFRLRRRTRREGHDGTTPAFDGTAIA